MLQWNICTVCFDFLKFFDALTSIIITLVERYEITSEEERSGEKFSIHHFMYSQKKFTALKFSFIGQLFETDNRNFSKFSIHHGGQCGREQCEFYAKCIKATTTTITKQKDKRKTCTCRKACSLFPRLVCGSDGRTYLSLCILEAVACRYRRSVFVVHSGKCEGNDLWAVVIF